MSRKKSKTNTSSYTQTVQKQKREAAFWRVFFGYSENLVDLPYHMNWVKLSFSNVSDEDLEFLTSRVRSIEMLDLKDTAITAEGIKHLLNLEYLSELRLKEAAFINDECLKYLGQLRCLTLLQVNYTAITPEGLKFLWGLTNLKELFLSFDTGEAAVREALDALHEALPSCEIIVNGKTYTQ